MIELGFRQPHLPGVLEPAGVGCGGDAVFVIGVDRACDAEGRSGCDDGAALVRQKPAAVCGPCAFIPNEGFVQTRTKHSAPQQRAGPVILRDGLRAVIEEPRRRPGRGRLPQTPQGVVGEGGRGRAGVRRARQPVEDIVAVGAGPEAREIAAAVISGRGLGDRGVLVEAVVGVIRGPVQGRGRVVGCVGARAREDLRGGVVGEGAGEILRRAGEVLRQGLQPGGGVIAVSGGRASAAAPGKARAAAEVVIGESGEDAGGG